MMWFIKSKTSVGNMCTQVKFNQGYLTSKHSNYIILQFNQLVYIQGLKWLQPSKMLFHLSVSMSLHTILEV